MKTCLGPAQNCVRFWGKEERDSTTKQCVEQVDKSGAGHHFTALCRLLLVKLPRGCHFHNGKCVWPPGYVSSHLYWRHPPISVTDGWGLLQHQSLLSLGRSSPCGRILKNSSALYSFLVLWWGLRGTSGPERGCASVAPVLSTCCLSLTTSAGP